MKKRISAAAIIALALIVFSCIEVKDVVFPSNAKINGDFTVTATVEVDATNDGNGFLVVGLLLPKSWDVTNKGITATYTTQGMADFFFDEAKDPGHPKKPGYDVTNEAMVLVTAEDIEPATGKPYPEAMAEKLGMLENTDEMEWVVFKGTTEISVRGGDSNATDASTGEHYVRPNDAGKAFVTIKTKAGSDVFEFKSAVASCITGLGLGSQGFGYDPSIHGPSPDYYHVSEAQTVTVSAIDYDKFVTFSPAGARFGDYIGAKFTPAGTDLESSDVVYLKATCTADGKAVAAKTVAMKKDGSQFVTYIYPKSFFGVGESANITAINVWFTNADGSVVFGPEEGLAIEQAAE